MDTIGYSYRTASRFLRTFYKFSQILPKSCFKSVPTINLLLISKLHDDMNMDLKNTRSPYNDRSKSFDVKDLVSREPIGQFKAWLEEQIRSGKSVEPNAVCLSTCTKSGFPSSRMVLLKDFGKEGFTFFTNYSSRKGLEMQENPNVALLFYWEHPKRQVRIEGKIVRLSPEESDEYFHSRPWDSQIGATVSPQSKVVTKSELHDNFEVMKRRYLNQKNNIPRPKHWGGITVIPEVVEFWQGQSDRLHDRLRFRKRKNGEVSENVKLFDGEDGWVIERLAP